MATIAVYAGHGGTDAGVSVLGRKEEDITLAVSNTATAILRSRGYTVVNNRTTNVERNIVQDAITANNNRVNALISIHMNSNDGIPGSGSEAFISIRDNGRARILASAILTRLEALGFPNRGVMTSVTATGQDSFGILRLTNMPAVILECAFMNNPEEMAHFDIESVATAIADGVQEAVPNSQSSNKNGSAALAIAMMTNIFSQMTARA